MKLRTITIMEDWRLSCGACKRAWKMKLHPPYPEKVFCPWCGQEHQTGREATAVSEEIVRSWMDDFARRISR